MKPNNFRILGILLLLLGIFLMFLFQVSIAQFSTTLGQETPKPKLLDVALRISPVMGAVFLSLPYIISFGVLLIAGIFGEFISSIKKIWKLPLILTIFVTLVTIGARILDFENAYMILLLFFCFLISNFVYGKKNLRFKLFIWIFGNPFFILLLIIFSTAIILHLVSR